MAIYSYRNSKSYLEFFILSDNYKFEKLGNEIWSEVDGHIPPEMLRKREVLLHDEIKLKKKRLKEFCANVHQCLDAIDKEMVKPSTFERGKRIAKITNSMQMELHRIEHIHLGVLLKDLK